MVSRDGGSVSVIGLRGVAGSDPIWTVGELKSGRSSVARNANCYHPEQRTRSRTREKSVAVGIASCASGMSRRPRRTRCPLKHILALFMHVDNVTDMHR